VPEENQRTAGVQYFDGDMSDFPTADRADKLLNGIFGKPDKELSLHSGKRIGRRRASANSRYASVRRFGV
jgi:hypothetical protein